MQYYNNNNNATIAVKFKILNRIQEILLNVLPSEPILSIKGRLAVILQVSVPQLSILFGSIELLDHQQLAGIRADTILFVSIKTEQSSFARGFGDEVPFHQLKFAPSGGMPDKPQQKFDPPPLKTAKRTIPVSTIPLPLNVTSTPTIPIILPIHSTPTAFNSTENRFNISGLSGTGIISQGISLNLCSPLEGKTK